MDALTLPVAPAALPIETPITPMPFGVPADIAQIEQPGDADLVEKALLTFDWENVQLSKSVMQQVLIDADADKRLYDAIGGVDESNAEDQEQDPKTPESAAQSDMIRAQYNEALFGSSDTFKAIAKQSADQPKADTSIRLIKDVWRDYGMEDELDSSLWDYLNSPYSGLKTVVHSRLEPVAENHEVQFSDVAIMDFETQMHAEKKAFQRIGIDEDRGKVIYEVTYTRQIQDCVGEAVDPTCLYMSNRKVRRISDVPSMHQVHCWTYEQIEGGGFGNLDKLGPADASDRVRPVDQAPNQENLHGQENYTNGNFDRWEIWETWGCIPWGKWLRSGAFKDQDLQAFADRYKFDVHQCGFRDETNGNAWVNNNQKWRRFHNKNSKGYFRFATSYLFSKADYPYNIASFIRARRELIGRSYISRLKEWEGIIHAATAMLADNIRYKLYQSVFADSLSGLDKTKWKDSFKRKGYVEMEKGMNRWEDMIKPSGEFFEDMTGPAVSLLNVGKGCMQTYGAPNILMASGNSETATQDTINLEKGTSKITHPLRRWVENVLLPCVTQIRDFNHQNFSGERWIAAEAEAGTAMAKEERPITRQDLTNRFRVVGAVAYDYATRPTKINHMLAMLNISAKVVSPEAYYKLLGSCMELMDIDREIIDAVTNNNGRGTSPEDEIRTMKTNHWAKPKVLPEDDHLRAIMLLDDTAARMDMEEPGSGQMFLGQDNVSEWSRDHLYYLDQQLAMIEEAKAMQGAKGNPKQRPNEGADGKEGETKQGAQGRSPADNAPPGMTGQASMAAMSAGNMGQPGTGL